MDDDSGFDEEESNYFYDWSDADINDVIEEILKYCPRRMWLILDDNHEESERVNDTCWRPDLCVSYYLKIPFFKLREILEPYDWGKQLRCSAFMRPKQGQGLSRSDGTYVKWFLVDPSRVAWPCKSPGWIPSIFLRLFSIHSAPTIHGKTGEIFPKGSIRQGKWFSLKPEEQEKYMKTKVSEQPHGCWDVPNGGWKSNTQHLPEAPEILSPGPRVSSRDRRSPSLTAEYVTPPQGPKRRRSTSREVFSPMSFQSSCIYILSDSKCLPCIPFYGSRLQRFPRETVMEGSS